MCASNKKNEFKSDNRNGFPQHIHMADREMLMHSQTYTAAHTCAHTYTHTNAMALVGTRNKNEIAP